jgi:hypothetical protein
LASTGASGTEPPPAARSEICASSIRGAPPGRTPRGPGQPDAGAAVSDDASPFPIPDGVQNRAGLPARAGARRRRRAAAAPARLADGRRRFALAVYAALTARRQLGCIGVAVVTIAAPVLSALTVAMR